MQNVSAKLHRGPTPSLKKGGEATPCSPPLKFTLEYRQDLPHQSFLGHSSRVAESLQLGTLHSDEKWLNIQGFANFTAAQFDVKYCTVNCSQKYHLYRLHFRCILLVITQDL